MSDESDLPAGWEENEFNGRKYWTATGTGAISFIKPTESHGIEETDIEGQGSLMIFFGTTIVLTWFLNMITDLLLNFERKGKQNLSAGKKLVRTMKSSIPFAFLFTPSAKQPGLGTIWVQFVVMIFIMFLFCI